MRAVGDAAERQAAAFLEGQGYRVVARNVVARGGELDVVALDRGVLCFVEVRARASTRFGAPEETVGRVKQARIAKVAERFLATWPDRDVSCRFDVVSVGPAGITLFRDAFRL